MPLVLVNRAEAKLRTTTVAAEDKAGLELAVTHLVALGHRRIGHLAGPQHVSTGLWRFEGFKQAMAKAKLPSQYIVFAEAYSREAGKVAALKLLSGAKLTAVAAANDLLALGCYEALTELGLACPRDISIVGYNDMPLVDLVKPALTTIQINSAELGLRAGRRVVELIETRGGKVQYDLLKPTLIKRQSTGHAARA
jgi:LacI family transcriptional regulator